MALRLKWVYDPADKADGIRILVDRVWPRGMTKEDAQVDEWLRELGPSTELRKWFKHGPERWTEFRSRYQAELAKPEQRERLDHIRDLAAQRQVTLVYGARDREHNQAVVIAEAVGA